ncbi:hypothetical protein FA95DRAFT_1500564 [Auriscalpium vulgare]|uniref:Uncharacterized protein n=1 Tax=Auriscalpium vulgare TaxID=40419 RepID=A0ACB8RCZ0_9AGAM|nr:hypothetical protein FA95DRAFT_1500564 [Auriscalpium vulgare]
MAATPLVRAAATVIEGSALVQDIENGINRFFEGMPVFMNALDSVAQVHPFIAVAVMAFKTVYTLEVKRRGNEKKVIALYVEMKDMMAVLLQLQDIRDNKVVAPDKTTIEDRLKSLVEKTAEDIKACSNACDTYCKKKLLAKVFQSALWDSKLLSFVDVFEKRRTAIEFALSIHTAETVEAMTAKLSSVDDSTKQVNAKIDVLMTIFESLVSKEQKAIANIVAANGGAKVVRNNDKLLAALDNAVARAEDTEIRSTGPAALDELRDDLMDDPETAVAKNMAIFSRKFEVQKRQIVDEITLVVQRETDRIIKEVRMGAHDRIIDKSIHDIWKEMGWRGNVKARHFVLALRDSFMEKLHDKTPKIKGISATKNDEIDPDAWAIQYIDVMHLQPILEAFDDDASGFITVSEMNRFTSSRPIDWSLPHWIAYWAIGWHSTIINYARKIETFFSKMEAIHAKLLPANRRLFDEYDAHIWSAVHLLSATVKNDQLGPHQDKFMKYVEAEENRLRENLKAVDYFIDEANTLTLIAGIGRVEKTAFPLIYLLFERHYEIMKIGTKKILSQREIIDAGNSVGFVTKALKLRTKELRNIFTQQKMDPAKQFQSFAFGVFKYYDKESDLWKPGYLKSLGSNTVPYVVSKEEEKPEEILRYPFKDELALDFSAYYLPVESEEQASIDGNPTSATPLGRWCGTTFWQDGRRPCSGETIQAITLTAGNDENTIQGTGYNSKGHFKIEGSCTTSSAGATEVSFTLLFGGTQWRNFFFKGVLHPDSDYMSGTWTLSRTSAGLTGLLVYKRNVAPEHMSFYPSPWSLKENKARALWTFAIESIRHDIRRAWWSWTYFKERRDVWKLYSAFFLRWRYCGPPLTAEDTTRFGNVGLRIAPSDACLYGSRIQRIQATTAIHQDAWCDVCNGLIGGARLVCLDCDVKQENAFNSLDLCDAETCVNSIVTVERRDDLLAPHLPTHHVYKVRTTILRRQLGKLDRKARTGLNEVEPLCILLATRKAAGEATTAAPDASSSQASQQALAPLAPRSMSRASKRFSTATTATDVEEHPVPCCGVCDEPLTLPCWYCLDCHNDNLYICKSCDDKGVPKLKCRPEHTDEHALVRCQEPTPTEKKVSVDERLSTLEDRIGNLDGRIGNIESRMGNFEDRMGKIEQLLLHVVDVLKVESRPANVTSPA